MKKDHSVQSLLRFLHRGRESNPATNPLILIPTFNNGNYLSHFIEQLNARGLTNYLVIDGGSSDESTAALLDTLEEEEKLVRVEGNPGPRYFFENKSFYAQLPEVFCVSDPDLELNSNLPEDFVARLILLSSELNAGKVGFALSLEGDIKSDEFFFGKRWSTIRDWESQFWKTLTENSLGLPVYEAALDTTFALYNKKYLKKKSFFHAYRVAGDYTAKHLPWHENNPVAEKNESAVGPSKFSTWDLASSREKEREALSAALRKIDAMERSLSWRLTLPVRKADSLFRVARAWLASHFKR